MVFVPIWINLADTLLKEIKHTQKGRCQMTPGYVKCKKKSNSKKQATNKIMVASITG